ncbi:MAG: LPXTG cell wall anchor domain-containing protein, partial [Candidatus Phosphoribacter baldrii]
PPAGHTFENLTLGGDGVTVNNGTATLTIGNDTTTTVTALNTYGVEDVTDVDDDSDNDGGDATDTEVDQLASTGPMGIVWFLLIAGVATAGGALLLRLRRRLG